MHLNVVVAVTKRDDLAIARKYLRECFARQSSPRVRELAQILSVSRATLNAAFRERVGLTASDFLKSEQVEEAKRLLRETSWSVTRIAYCAAFGTRRTLHRAFLRITGIKPETYRLNSSKRL